MTRDSLKKFPVGHLSYFLLTFCYINNVLINIHFHQYHVPFCHILGINPGKWNS